MCARDSLYFLIDYFNSKRYILTLLFIHLLQLLYWDVLQLIIMQLLGPNLLLDFGLFAINGAEF
jgi:hypothetical protein